MIIKIEGTPREIAALVVELQERQEEEFCPETALGEDSRGKKCAGTTTAYC